MPLRSWCFVCRRAQTRSAETIAVPWIAPMPGKADLELEGSKAFSGQTRIRAGIRIGRFRRSMPAGVRLRIIPLTAGSMRRAIVRRIPAFTPAIAIRALHLRDIWVIG